MNVNQEIQIIEHEVQPTFNNQTAQMLIASGLFGQKYKKPEEMMAIVLMGKEQGLSPMQALTYGYNIQGRSDIEVKARWANVQKAKNSTGGSLLSKCVTKVSNDESCTVILERNNGDCKSSVESTYTIQQAEKAGLLNRPIWKQHPAKMLYWRALGNAIDMLFPDVRIGLHKQYETVDEAVLGSSDDEVEDWNKKEPEPKIEQYINNKQRQLFIITAGKNGWTEKAQKELLGSYNIVSRSLIPLSIFQTLLDTVSQPYKAEVADNA